MKLTPHEYQVAGAMHLFNHRYGGLFWSPGLGKTSVTLLAFIGIQKRRIPGAKILIIAPLRVALKTWPDEIQKWDETKHLRYVVLHGKDKAARLQQDVDVYIINYEGLAWLWEQLADRTKKGKWPFHGVVFDELTKFKNTNTSRYREMKKRLFLFQFRWGLTGTPAPNSLLELFGQMMVVDGGNRLGPYKGQFLRQYFFEESMYNWVPIKGAVQAIQRKIGDIMHHLDPKEHLNLPRRVDVRVPIDLPEDVMQAYRDLEYAEVLRIEDLDTIQPAHAAALIGKLQQITQGFLYASDEETKAHRLHEAKLDALEEIIEEANGQPVFVVYKFIEDLKMLKERFPQGVDLYKDVEKRIDDWNAGKLPIVFAQPQSAGHGLNMQHGGHIIVWYALNHSLEQYIQANGRIDRQGQTHPVTVHHLVVEGTVDADIMATLASRDRTQKNLLEGLKRRIVANGKAA